MAALTQCDRCREHQITGEPFGRLSPFSKVAIPPNATAEPGAYRQEHDLCKPCLMALQRWMAEPPARCAPESR